MRLRHEQVSPALVLLGPVGRGQRGFQRLLLPAGPFNRGFQRLTKRLVSLPESPHGQLAPHGRVYRRIDRVERLTGQVRQMSQRNQGKVGRPSIDPVQPGRGTGQLRLECASGLVETPKLRLVAIGRRRCLHARAKDRLFGQQRVEQREGRRHGLCERFPVGTPARPKRLERADFWSRTRCRRRLSPPGFILLKRRPHPPVGRHPEHVRTRTVEPALKPGAIVQLEKQHAVPFGYAHVAQRAAQCFLEQGGDVATRPAVALDAKHVAKGPCRDAHHPLGLGPGKGQHQLVAHLREGVAQQAAR